MYKGFLNSMFLMLTLVLLVPVSFASFNDVSDDSRNKQAIEFLKDGGVLNGYEDGSFRPKSKINRAELVKILVESTGEIPLVESYNNCFPDVKTEWFAPYICYAKSMGWVSGFPDGTFKPEQPVKKVEALKMTLNAQGLSSDTTECKNLLNFKDINKDEWYSKYLCVAVQKGLLEEDENGDYVPSADISREQVTENVYRSILIRKLKKESFKEEFRTMKDQVLQEFKAEREALKLKRKELKDEVKALKKEYKDDFLENLKSIKDRIDSDDSDSDDDDKDEDDSDDDDDDMNEDS